MTTRTKRALSIATVCLTFIVAGCDRPTDNPAAGSSTAAVLHWTAIPDTNVELLKQKYDPISVYLEAKLGVAARHAAAA